MENLSDQLRRSRFNAFREAIKDRIHSVGIDKHATVRQAQAVERRLFERTAGDATAVTDESIAESFDALVPPPDQGND